MAFSKSRLLYFRHALRIAIFLQIVVTYYVSSVYLNLLQIAVTACRFVPKKRRLMFCRFFSRSWWRVSVFGLIRFLKVKFIFYGDDPSPARPGVFICNHSRGIDFMTIIVNLLSTGIDLSKITVMSKKWLLMVPAIGPMLFFQGSLFLDRNWQNDKSKIEQCVSKQLSERKEGIIAMFPEGTRFSDVKLSLCRKFAAERNLPLPKHVLTPRVKGFAELLSIRKHSFEFIYDFTIVYRPKNVRIRNFIFSKNLNCEVHVLRRFVSLDDFPNDKKGIADWLYKSFAEKDKEIDYYMKNGSFDAEKRDIKIPSFELNYFLHCILSGICIRFILGLICEYKKQFFGLWCVIMWMTTAEVNICQ
ncbi:hypothetical protein MHBO_002181 [Bonamia ostreae]|uniref:Phospholipid/glycerol acyltransferase domain-containing protein n=1 Tax=Bonamia ostreae TaxID=126728 RepID=A0ABV2ALH8_9EUKA